MATSRHHDPKIAAASTKNDGTGKAMQVVYTGDASLGSDRRKRGDKLGTVTLEEGVTLNYFVDAIRSGLAAEDEVVKEADEAAEAEREAAKPKKSAEK